MLEDKVKAVITAMDFDEKCMLITGATSLETSAIEKYDIPQINMSDGPHGIRRLIFPNMPERSQKINIKGGDTCFPTASAVGSSWNKSLAYQLGAALAKDCKEENIQVILAPGVNMKRTPHCGRNFEYFSEDPYLSGMMGAGFINGVQSEGVGTSLKHFAANNQEIQRGSINAEIDERSLREYYLRPFEYALENADPVSVMCAYNKLNGIWCSENRYLLTEILRDTWHYKGMVISDWGAVHDISKCIYAGLDYEMPHNPQIKELLSEALKAGTLTMEQIDNAAASVLKFIYTVSEMSRTQPKEAYSRDNQHNIAREIASETITLLRNDNNILPIDKTKCKKIAVLGRHAVDVMFMGGGSSKVTVGSENVDIPLDEIKKKIPEAQIDYFPLFQDGFRDVNVVDTVSNLDDDYEYILFFAGDNYCGDSETEDYDRDNLYLPNYMNSAISLASEKKKNVVLILQTGAAVLPRRWEKVPAILQMWYSGEAAGSALADILFGDVNPSGKLSETFMNIDRTDLDYPGDGKKVCYNEKWNSGYRYYDKHADQIWFPFGHGLSYTAFEYSDISIPEPHRCRDNFTLTLSCKIKNIGDRSGKEVVQLYIAPQDNITDRPLKELKRFEKIALEPGEGKEVFFDLNERDFAYYNTCLHSWHTERGHYDIMIGSSSRDIRLVSRIFVDNEKDYTILPKNAPMLA